MASVVYPLAKDAFLKEGIHWTSDTIKVQLVDTGDYTYSAAHQYLSDLTAAGRVGTGTTITGCTCTNGVADGADVTLSSVSGDQSEALVVYQDTGDSSTSQLIAYIDAFASGMPVTPNGGDIEVQWATGGTGIFSL